MATASHLLSHRRDRLLNDPSLPLSHFVHQPGTIMKWSLMGTRGLVHEYDFPFCVRSLQNPAGAGLAREVPSVG